MVRRDLASLLTRIGDWALGYSSLILILFVGIDALNKLFTQKAGIELLPQTFSMMVAFLILTMIGDWLGSVSKRIDDDIEKQLVGFLLSTPEPISVGKVAGYLSISTKHAVKTFFKAKSKKMLKGFTFDAEKTEIIPPNFQAQANIGRPLATTPTTIAEELLRRAKLIELERLKVAGKISEEAYKELRKELEGT
jgi:hypothetical protein